MSVVDEIKARLDIVDIIGQTVQLKKAGRIYKGLCPFHGEKTPSFIVYPEQGTWHCFGACGAGGDVFSFVMKRDNLDFGDALKLLAPRAGVELHREGDAADNTKPLLEMHQVAADYYHYLLLNHPAAQYAREYLVRRHINRSSVDHFQLGLALTAPTRLKDHLETKGFNLKEAERAGLVIANDVGGGYRDRFRGRLMFPIRNRRGQTIGFGARALEPDQQPKYLNSPETPLFSKSDILYGLDAAKDAIRTENLAVIVEGYTDVIVAHQEGFKNVIAAMGTALTEKQLSQLQRLTKRYALALDADVAGAAATERGLELARQALEHKRESVPIGPGMIVFKERLDAELLIITLPEGRDPDEVILENGAHWRELVTNAIPILDYYFDVQTHNLDLRTAEGKSEALKRLLPIIAKTRDTVQRNHYSQQLARLIQVEQRVIADQLKLLESDNKPTLTARPSRESPLHPKSTQYDEHLLALALAQLHLLPHVQFLTGDDFADGRRRELWEALQHYLASGIEFEVEEFLEGLSEAARAEGERLRGLGQPSELSELETVRELEAAACRLRLQRHRSELTQLQYLLAEATPAERPPLERQVNELYVQMRELDRAIMARTVLRNAAPSTWTPQIRR